MLRGEPNEQHLNTPTFSDSFIGVDVLSKVNGLFRLQKYKLTKFKSSNYLVKLWFGFG